MTTSARILVIDDEAPIRRFLRIALEAEGYLVSEAGTARDGISATARENPALVVLDLGLPDADGLSVLREIRGWSGVRGLIRDRTSDAPQAVVDIGPLHIDAADHSASLQGRPLHPTRREFDLLWMLASHRGRLVTQDMILKTLWGPAHAEDSHYLRVYIRQLRQKLGDDAANPRFIFTEPGVGYRLAEA